MQTRGENDNNSINGLGPFMAPTVELYHRISLFSFFQPCGLYLPLKLYDRTMIFQSFDHPILYYSNILFIDYFFLLFFFFLKGKGRWYTFFKNFSLASFAFLVSVENEHASVLQS